MSISLIATNEMQSVNDHSLSGRAEKNSVPRWNRSLVDGRISTSDCSLRIFRSRTIFAVPLDD